MSSTPTHLDPLYALPSASLRALASSLRGGPLSVGLTSLALQPIAGSASPAVLDAVKGLLGQGMGPAQMAVMFDALAEQSDRLGDVASLFDIVLSGPDVPSVPTADTGAVMQTLIAEARQSIMLVGYAVHNGKRLFAPLSERMAAAPDLRVTMYLDISRPHKDTSMASEIVRRFAQEFRAKHWPWKQFPTLLYDPRALAEGHEVRASLHAKCVIVDRKAALITSANFTEAAQQRNIEAGVLVRHPPLVERLARYLEGLRTSAQLQECVLLA